MDYAALIRDAWQLTWRYRFLWVLGLFAGGTLGLSGWSGGAPGRQQQPDLPTMPGADADAAARGVAAWVQTNVSLVATAAVVFVVLGLVLLVVSLIAQGAMARATADLARGRRSSLGLAWQAGLRTFWRYLGLWLLLIGIALGVALVVAVLVALVVSVAAVWAVLGVVLGIVVLVPLILLAVSLAVAGSIVVAYAQRAIAVDNLGPGGALREGWDLLRAHPGASLLVCLLNLALLIAAGLAGGLALLAVLAPLGIIGALAWAMVGLGPLTIGYAALAGLVVVGAVLLLLGIANTFLWNFWTLAYLRLSGPPDSTPATA